MNSISIKVKDIIDTEFAVANEDGNLLYSEIKNIYDKYNEIILDFENIQRFTTAFFNSSIAILLKDHPVKEILHKIKFQNLNTTSIKLLLKSITVADKKFSDNFLESVKEDQYGN